MAKLYQISCPKCNNKTDLHHDKEYYSNYRCCDKKCNHSLFVPKSTAISAPSMSKLFGKTDFKRMRYPVHVILMALSMFYLGKNSFRNIALILRLQLIPALNFNSDEWHADETVVKIQGEKYYLWLILDSETRFVLGFHVESFHDDITNNLISMFIFFYNFVRPHSALNNLTPAQCAGLKLSKKRKRELLLVA